jgi:hypothetical protein
MTWHPGRTADAQTVVELSFAAEGEATRVRLVHRGWEALGANAQASRESYDGGWDVVLVRLFGRYIDRTS